MIKLLVVSDLSIRGVTVPRLYSLERLTENGYPVTAKVRNKYPSTYDLEWCDVVYFLRCINEGDLNFIKKAKYLSKKVWVDTDDDLFNTPLDHRGYFDFNNEAVKTTYAEIHKIADYISYSTEELRDSHKKYNANCSVIPCAYPDEIVEHLTEKKSTNKIILWRGTDTHEKSLVEFGPSILEVAKSHTDWQFTFIGFKPWHILERMKNPWRVEPFMDVEDLLFFINQLRPSVHMQPRVDNAFTKSRSSISYVEATFGGAVTVAPDWKEWKNPGVLNYKNKKEFVKQMNSAIKMYGTKAHEKLVDKGVGFIKKFRTWKYVNNLQYAILLKLAGDKVSA